MRRISVLFFVLLVAVVCVVSVAAASYLMVSPDSVQVTVNAPGEWNWGPGWN